MKKQTYLITGGAGFIGTNMAEQLLAAGCTVIVVDDLSAGDAARLPPTAQFHQLDVRNTLALEKLCAGVDIVVHLAAQPRVQDTIDHPVETHDVNVNGTLSVLEAVRAAGVQRLVFASTAAIYGDQVQLPLTTELPAKPKSPYGLHKYIGEQYLKLWNELHGVQSVSLRFFNVYGPHFDPDGPYALVVGRFLKLRSEHKPLTIVGDGTQTRDFIHVSDVVRAVVAAAEHQSLGAGEVFNVGSGIETSVNEVAALIGGETELVPPRHEPKRVVADITETKRLLGWEPKETLAAGIAAMKAERDLD
jgi:UDP-glucose 4-epimerase